MCEGFGVGKGGDGFDLCVAARSDGHIAPGKVLCLPASKFCFKRLGTDKASRAEDEFRAGLLIVLDINVIPAGYHSAFAFANSAHVHREVPFGRAELFTSAEIRGYLRAVNNILTGQASMPSASEKGPPKSRTAPFPVIGRAICLAALRTVTSQPWWNVIRVSPRSSRCLAKTRRLSWPH